MGTEAKLQRRHYRAVGRTFEPGPWRGFPFDESLGSMSMNAMSRAGWEALFVEVCINNLNSEIFDT